MLDWLKYIAIGFVFTALLATLLWPDMTLGIAWALVSIGLSLAIRNFEDRDS
jgi:hypothetical protein